MSVEELEKGMKNRGKQTTDEQEDIMGDKIEAAVGEEFAIQVMQFEGDPCWNMEPGRGMAGPIDVTMATFPNQAWNAVDAYQTNLANTTEISMGPFIGGNAEPLYHINTVPDGSNLNVWGTPVFHFDTGNNCMYGGFQQGEIQMLVPCDGQSGMMIQAPIQLSAKGKELVKEGSTIKGRKLTVAEKGKAKVIATGHKTLRKEYGSKEQV